MTADLTPYIDFDAAAHLPPGTAKPHRYVGQVHTHLVSADADALLMNFDITAAKSHLHRGVVINVGGYMGYGLSYLTRAKALIHVDLNQLQGVHHKLHANLLAQIRVGTGYWFSLDALEAETNSKWAELFNTCWLTGFGAREHSRRGCFRRLKSSLHDVLYSKSYADKIICGLEEEAIEHNAELARSGQIYTAVVDLGCPLQMQAFGQFVDKVAAGLAAPVNGARAVPTVTFGSNAIDFMAGRMASSADFCGMPTSNERQRMACHSIDNLTFGEAGQNTASLITVDADEDGRVHIYDRHRTPGKPPQLAAKRAVGGQNFIID